MMLDIVETYRGLQVLHLRFRYTLSPYAGHISIAADFCEAHEGREERGIKLFKYQI